MIRLYPFFRYSRTSHRPGAVLFIVLGILFITSVIVSLFIELQMFRLRESAADYASDSLRTHAYGALEISLATLEEFRSIDGALYAQAQGWHSPLNYMPEFELPEGMSLSISIEDESGRRSLPKMGEPELIRMLEGLDIDLYDAQVMAQSLLDWTDKDELQRLNGAEKDYYSREDPEYEPPNRPLVSYEELRYIRGFRDAFYDEKGVPNGKHSQFRAMTTLYEIEEVNLNSASAALIEAMNTQDNYAITQLYESLSGTDGITGNEDDVFLRTLPEGMNLPNTGTQVSLLRIRIAVERALASFTLEALVTPSNSQGSGNGNYPYQILVIRENAPLP